MPLIFTERFLVTGRDSPDSSTTRHWTISSSYYFQSYFYNNFFVFTLDQIELTISYFWGLCWLINVKKRYMIETESFRKTLWKKWTVGAGFYFYFGKAKRSFWITYQLLSSSISAVLNSLRSFLENIRLGRRHLWWINYEFLKQVKGLIQ